MCLNTATHNFGWKWLINIILVLIETKQMLMFKHTKKKLQGSDTKNAIFKYISSNTITRFHQLKKAQI